MVINDLLRLRFTRFVARITGGNPWGEDFLKVRDADIEDIFKAVTSLNEGQKAKRRRLGDIIIHRFGLDGGEVFSQAQVAAMLGVSKSTLARLERFALDKLIHLESYDFCIFSRTNLEDELYCKSEEVMQLRYELGETKKELARLKERNKFLESLVTSGKSLWKNVPVRVHDFAPHILKIFEKYKIFTMDQLLSMCDSDLLRLDDFEVADLEQVKDTLLRSGLVLVG